MYELVNTSVPNGLIAGSHGFATVAMTKGMPDAIRSRVENLCAYPHRSSAHDQSYYTENPINWFHLLLPGGDHAVGRTAPAEFDYTGRTNRISRVLHFSSREMPINGGAYVLTAEANRFCQNWSGDPKYLPADKTLAGRLQMAVRAIGFPKNWVNMFGPDGESYAKKFAALLTQNLRTNKCIYFKAGESDVNGERLLGLFSDLINLLPEQLAAQVTFSTFSACVPNGAVCHLRGIFDKDRAFETASALQPWIDCGGCCVKHPELLPNDIPAATVGNDQSFGSTETDSNAARLDIRVRHAESNYQQRQSQMVDYWNRRTEEVKGKGRSWELIGLVCLFVLAVFALSVYFWGDEIKRRNNGSDVKANDPVSNGDSIHVNHEPNDMSGSDAWKNGQRVEIKRFQNEYDNCDSVDRLNELNAKVKKARQGLGNSAMRERFIVDKSVIIAVSKEYDALLDDIKGKLEKLKDDASSRQKDKKAEKDHNRDSQNNAPSLMVEEELSKAINNQAIESLSLKDLPIDEKILKPTEIWEDRIEKRDRVNLTNENSVVYFFLKDGHCVKVRSKFKKRPLTDDKYDRDTLKSEDARALRESPWFVVYLPSLKKAYWREPLPKDDKLFLHGGDQIDCVSVLFGDKEAYECYKQKFPDMIYRIDAFIRGSPSQNIRLYKKSRKVKIEDFAMADRKIKHLQKMSELEKSFNQITNQIAETDKKIETCKKDEQDMLKHVVDYQKYREEPKDEKEDARKERVEKRDKVLKDAFEKFSEYKLDVDKNKKKALAKSMKSEDVRRKVEERRKQHKESKDGALERKQSKQAEMEKEQDKFDKELKSLNVKDRVIHIRIVHLIEKGFEVAVPKQRPLTREDLDDEN